MNKLDILSVIEKDIWMMDVLKATAALGLADWWIGAGFVRNKVWDVLHGFERTPLNDVDVIYYNSHDFSKHEATIHSTKKEDYYQEKLRNVLPEVNWSVTNQARMHLFHNDKPYKNSEEALSYWVETATCVGVGMDNNDKLYITAPHGITDLVNLIVRPTLSTIKKNNIHAFNKRIKDKDWLSKWPKLTVATAV